MIADTWSRGVFGLGVLGVPLASVEKKDFMMYQNNYQLLPWRLHAFIATKVTITS